MLFASGFVGGGIGRFNDKNERLAASGLCSKEPVNGVKAPLAAR